ncbi:uncharacterized protein HD556DRAFT_932900 [Suillus plorans]|uniref:Uncharacterized protein n=1 Tax=Suillus plorans TaxID=116603 RepID=A0A9P7DD02_9AGAM|nr:uncharacterized protein HD556DRAFT_932900 [Suillus plorans]KAG1787844.1 hypothetical protein HD556DRAFT_932900 [Suillus plorans]
MSVNDTYRASSPEHEPELTAETTAEQIAELKESIPPSSAPIIAVDLDDVLSCTNAIVAKWHNETHGTQMTTNDFYYYFYWKNPFWGTPHVTRTKVKTFYTSGLMAQAQPVPGAREGVEALCALGYRLIIVTARGKDSHADSWAWVKRWFPGCFHSMICTGQFANSPKHATDGVDALAGAPKEHEVATRLSKAEVCIDIGAELLIDDSMENALACAYHIPLDGVTKPPPVLLFGSYEWNKRLSVASDECDDMVYEVRLQREGGKFLEEDVERGDKALEQANTHLSVRRARDWSEVVRYVAELKGGRL